eukprot:gnl/TRDRNA2_/TRDRNA2_199828_c0_seq1.p2 gnl/TRDRNA2_/TRDRNA2_199828_c0~~gnl/TRDRNA2_/TRDRNA2_199828_c0_seq1.p2  ORF type:complete len:275 (+),score=39.00 gnl/TRDRNA2_/TRDRNA2_199828_c0_seq1:77-901(+)
MTPKLAAVALLVALGLLALCCAQITNDTGNIGMVSAEMLDQLKVPASPTSLPYVLVLTYVTGAIGFWLPVAAFALASRFNESWQPKEQKWPSYRQAVVQAVINLHIVLPLYMMMWAYLFGGVVDGQVYNGPTVLSILKDSLIIMLVDDFVFYFFHRLWHSHPVLYKVFHSKHHAFHDPVPPAVFYTHALDFVLSYATQFTIAPMLVAMGYIHPYVCYGYSFAGVAGAVAIHAGVGLRFALPHAYHHKYTSHSYGVWGLTDLVLGTFPPLWEKSA